MKRYVLSVLVILFVGLIVSSCGGKGAKVIRTAPRDLVNSVKNRITGKGGKTVSSGDDYLDALNPAEGSVKWQYQTGGPVMSSPAIDSDGTIYVGSDDKNVYAFGP